MRAQAICLLVLVTGSICIAGATGVTAYVYMDNNPGNYSHTVKNPGEITGKLYSFARNQRALAEANVRGWELNSAQAGPKSHSGSVELVASLDSDETAQWSARADVYSEKKGQAVNGSIDAYSALIYTGDLQLGVDSTLSIDSSAGSGGGSYTTTLNGTGPGLSYTHTISENTVAATVSTGRSHRYMPASGDGAAVAVDVNAFSAVVVGIDDGNIANSSSVKGTTYTFGTLNMKLAISKEGSPTEVVAIVVSDPKLPPGGLEGPVDWARVVPGAVPVGVVEDTPAIPKPRPPVTGPIPPGDPGDDE